MLRRALILALLGAVFVADCLVPANIILSFAYCLALLAVAPVRSRRWLWGVAAASVVLTLLSPIVGAPVTPGSPRWVMWNNRGLTVLALLAIGVAIDRSLVSLARRERAEAALRDSEQSFRTVFESAAIGIARVAFEGERWIEVNDTFCRMLGRTREEMLATPWPAMTHPDDVELDLVPFRRMAAGELDSYAVDKRFIHKDGHPVWARLTLSLVRDAQGRPDYEIAVMEDISARKAQEEKLAEIEARQRELLATLDLGASMARAPLDDAIRFWSAGCEHLYGWTAEEAVGRPAHELLRTIFPVPREVIAAALEQDGEWTGDLRQRRRDGAEIVVSAHKLLRRDQYGQPLEVLESLADVTAHRRAEAALAESEARQGELLATLDLGASMTRDPFDDTIRFWSLGCEHMYGWTAEQALGRPAHVLLQTVFPVSRAEIAAALERDGEWIGDLRQRRRDGAEIVVSAHKALRRDPDGRPVAVLESLADVTTQREAEQVLARDKAELERLVEARSRELDESRARAAHAERLQALGQLAGGIAHDFNNVLQAVQGGVALIEKRATGNEDIRRLAGMIAEAAGRGSAITRRLLAFSRRGDLRAEAVDPAALFGGLREVLDQTLGAAIEVRVEAPADLPPLLADKSQLETVLINLATNARDAMPDGGVLTFAAALETVQTAGAAKTALTTGPYVRLSVTDTGVGMPREMLARVTEPFFTTKGEGKGTGLGLAMAKGFAEQSGGALQIESAPGQGTAVTLWFPLAPATVSPAGRKPTAAAPAAAGRRRAHILLVDDEDIVREVTAEQLREQGFTVVPVSSGPAALALLDAGEAADLMISDLGMPGMDGVALLREAQQRRSGLPVILLTGSPDDAAEQAASGDGFALVRKPVTGEQLAERATTLLDGAAGGS